MKTRNLLLTGLFGLGMMTACSNEEAIGNQPEIESGNAQLQIQLTVANNTTPSTRADVGLNAGTADEYKVNHITVVLADESDIAKHVYKKQRVKAATGVDNTNQEVNVASEVFNVEAGTYKVYVLANYDDSYMTPIIANSTDMKSTIFTVAEYNGANCPLASTGTDKGFLMTDTEAPTTTTTITANASDKEFNSDGSETAGGKEKVNKVTATIERSVAKVTFNQTQKNFTVEDVNGTEIADAVIESVDLLNLNSQMFLNKKAVAYANGMNLGYDDLYYAQDPNYTTAWNTAWSTSGNPFYSSTANNFQSIDNAPKFYCLENTMEAGQQLHGLTTGAIYKVKYTPVEAQYTELAYNANATGLSKTFTEIVDANDEATDKDATISATMFDRESTATSFYVYDELIFANENAAKMYRAIIANSGKTATEIIAAYQSSVTEEIAEYTDGYCYYTVWIRHNTHSSAGYMEQGKYGVIRNHWYTLTASGIKKLGNSKPTYETPEEPDDKSDVYLQVLVTINPWRLISQSMELE